MKGVLKEFTDFVHANTNDEGLVMQEVPAEGLTTEEMMGYYECSDFPFNFNFVVKLLPFRLSGKRRVKVIGFLRPNFQDITSKIKLLNGLKICRRVKLPIGS